MLRLLALFVLGICLLNCHLAKSIAAEFKLVPGDRVVWLGDGLIEQEQYSGWLELMVTAAFPNVDATFRNLGWSGDTPAGASRGGLSLLQAGKEPPDEGWRQLQAQLELTKPTVLWLGYGLAAGLEGGPQGVVDFSRDLERLIQTASEISPNVRFVFFTPLLPLRQDSRGEVLSKYAESIRTLATRLDAPLVDLSDVARVAELRQDDIHLNEPGYKALAKATSEQLDLPPSDWLSSPVASELREVILRKNEWWFHRSRPANMAYVFGFRKHEQGQNAVEIPKFDALIAREEGLIGRLRGLEPVDLPAQPTQLESQYAEFTEQPRPEFTIADGWEVTLWAENPQLNKPIHMNFDPQGRLWVASSEAYPMIEVGQTAPDKVLVLEDTTGDGRADRSTVFAEGLLIPTGIAPGNGGVYVAQSTDLLFLRDTDGDGKADEKQRVLSGFGTEDTHHNLHTLLWGKDGRLYMNQSVYTRSDAETPHGVVRLKAGGGFRLATQDLRMEVFFRGLWNSWGHQFDAFGNSFLTDGAGFDGLAYTFPGAKFNPTPGAARQLGLISPGKYPKFASLDIIQGASYPPDWQGSLVTCDFRANRVTRFRVFEQDSGFVTEQQEDLLRTSASTFRPIDVKQGPDGALYIADWSNPIINHGEVDFRDPRRDRWHGRIWRVAWKGAPHTKRVDLTSLSFEQLLDKLTNGDQFQCEQARRVLIERGPQMSRLTDWLERQTDPAVKLQGLWLCQAWNLPNAKLLEELLSATQGDLRVAATRVLGCWSDPQAVAFEPIEPAAALELLSRQIRDPHPRVRLEAICGLTKIGTAEAGFVALDALSQPMDRFMQFALAESAYALADPLMAAIESGSWQANSPERERQLEFVLSSIEPQRASRFLRQHLASEPISRDGSGPWIELIGTAGGVPELTQLAEQTKARRLDSAATQRALEALADAARLRNLRPQAAGRDFHGLLADMDPAVRLSAVRLAGAWKLAGQADALLRLAGSVDESLALREAAVDALGSLGKSTAMQQLLELAQEADPAIQKRAVASLFKLDASQAVRPFFRILAQTDSEDEALALWRSALANGQAGKLLASRAAGEQISAVAARAGVRAAREGGRDEAELLATLTPLSGLSLTADELSPERIAELAMKALQDGDAERGESVYRRNDLACASCHAIGGVGGNVGPDMTSLGASAPPDYIIESLFNPNAKIKEGFHALTVATEDGLVLSGIPVENTETELVLRDVSNKLIRISKNEILDTKPANSLMPTGVVDRLLPAEQLDLIRFLTELGKPGDFDGSRTGVARYFEVFAGTHRIEQQGTDRIISGELKQGWQPLVTRVGGQVPMSEVRELTKQPLNIALVHVYLRTSVTLSRDAEATFLCTAKTPLAMWLDGHPIEGSPTPRGMEFEQKLPSGRHTVILRLDARDLPTDLQLLADGVSFATGMEISE